MKAIVTAIDEPWREEIAGIWGELKAVFGLGSLTGALRPYLTFHVAEEYDAGIEEPLNRIANLAPPFALETHGVGITEGQQSIIYLHVTRTEALDEVHHVIWHATHALARNIKPAYAAETWLPHIAIATGPIDHTQVEGVLAFLNRREYNWSIPATNVCLIPDTRLVGGEWARWDLLRVVGSS